MIVLCLIHQKNLKNPKLRKNLENPKIPKDLKNPEYDKMIKILVNFLIHKYTKSG